MELRLSKSLADKLQSATRSKVARVLVPLLGVVIVLQVYFFRELLAAELLFGLVFAIVLVLFGLFYLIGALGERGLNQADVAARAFGRSARRGYGAIEEIGKKSVRHPESVQ
jgi:hypothetical protein